MTDQDVRLIPRFADPDATKVIPLPVPCRCPGEKHEPDTATIRTELGGGERQSVATSGFMQGSSVYDWEVVESRTIVLATVEWTLHDPKTGTLFPVTFETVHRRLDSVTRKALGDAINEAHAEQLAAEQARLPNASSVRSRASSRANASPTPRTRTPSSRTKRSSSRGAASASRK